MGGVETMPRKKSKSFIDGSMLLLLSYTATLIHWEEAFNLEKNPILSKTVFLSHLSLAVP